MPKKNIKLFVISSYSITSLLIILLFVEKIGMNFSSVFIIIFILSLIYQINTFDKNSAKKCLNCFKFNNYSGLALFLAIYTF